MKILFWNTNRNNEINNYIVSLIQDNDIDIVVLAEYKADEEELKELFLQNNLFMNKCNTIGCNRIHIWSNYSCVDAGAQDDYYSIQIFNNDIILCGTHMFSDLNGDHDDERVVLANQIVKEIENVEARTKSKKVVIIGDMNESPYGKGCLNANGFHGLPSLKVTDKETRVVRGVKYRKYYNPMWNLMGDVDYPPGTYYLNKAMLNSPMWYMLDQVIVSKAVLPYFVHDSLAIVTECSYGDLKDERLHPNKIISDHFPIVCEISINGL